VSVVHARYDSFNRHYGPRRCSPLVSIRVHIHVAAQQNIEEAVFNMQMHPKPRSIRCTHLLAIKEEWQLWVYGHLPQDGAGGKHETRCTGERVRKSDERQ